MSEILPVPANLRPCQTYLKLANDHEKISPTLTYWSRLYALQIGLKIDSKSKETRDFLFSVMNWLEKEKKVKESDEKFTNELVAQAHVENYGMKIFSKADEDDRAGKATKNTAKQFFTAAQIFDMTAVFGEVGEELMQKSKYAKWRAAYIIKCIKNDEIPQPPEEEKKDDLQINVPSNDQQNHSNIGKPPAPFNDYNVNNLNDLSISKPPSSSSKYSNTDHFAQPPIVQPSDVASFSLVAMNGFELSRDHIVKAQKYSKWASSAMDYDDIKTAVDNLQKALNILMNGRDN